jgi:hypothetical protein
MSADKAFWKAYVENGMWKNFYLPNKDVDERLGFHASLKVEGYPFYDFPLDSFHIEKSKIWEHILSMPEKELIRDFCQDREATNDKTNYLLDQAISKNDFQKRVVYRGWTEEDNKNFSKDNLPKSILRFARAISTTEDINIAWNFATQTKNLASSPYIFEIETSMGGETGHFVERSNELEVILPSTVSFEVVNEVKDVLINRTGIDKEFGWRYSATIVQLRNL